MTSKCKFNGKYADEICDTLSKKIKGIESGTIVERVEGKRIVKGILVLMQSGKEKIAMNNCPFCGEKIYECDR